MSKLYTLSSLARVLGTSPSALHYRLYTSRGKKKIDVEPSVKLCGYKLFTEEEAKAILAAWKKAGAQF